MTQDELDQTLDRMFAEAQTEDAQPGVITVSTDDWTGRLAGVRGTCASLQDGLRYREIQVLVTSTFETRVLPRREADGRGAPYRELTPRSNAGIRPLP